MNVPHFVGVSSLRNQDPSINNRFDKILSEPVFVLTHPQPQRRRWKERSGFEEGKDLRKDERKTLGQVSEECSEV